MKKLTRKHSAAYPLRDNPILDQPRKLRLNPALGRVALDSRVRTINTNSSRVALSLNARDTRVTTRKRAKSDTIDARRGTRRRRKSTRISSPISPSTIITRSRTNIGATKNYRNFSSRVHLPISLIKSCVVTRFSPRRAPREGAGGDEETDGCRRDGRRRTDGGRRTDGRRTDGWTDERTDGWTDGA